MIEIFNFLKFQEFINEHWEKPSGKIERTHANSTHTTECLAKKP